MGRWRAVVHKVMVVMAVCGASAASVRGDESLEAFDARVTEELRAMAPGAVDEWVHANAARDRRDVAAAERGYREVLARAPGFHHAHRRLCNVLAMTDRGEEAVGECRAALAAADSEENRVALAVALMASSGPDHLEDARRLLAGDAAAMSPSANVLTTWCQLASLRNDEMELQGCMTRLPRTAPDHPLTHVFLLARAADAEDWDGAERHLEQARPLLGEEGYRRMKAALEARKPTWPSLLRGAGIGFGAWLGGMVLLFLLGMILSFLTLRSAERPSTDLQAHTSGGQRGLRRIYGAVLWLVSLYYYLSLPFILVAVLALGGGLIYLSFAVGHIPIKLVLLIGFFMVVTCIAIARSLFVRVKDEDPGTRLDLARHPQLRDLLTEVAGRVGTPPVHTVYMTPGTEIAVMERGGMLKQLRGKSERCLILGAGVIEGMKRRELRAILGHEYGHLSHEDTAGGGFALAVQRSLMTFGIGLAQAGAATWYNPAWWFFRGFFSLFLRISHGATRLQEILADRRAAIAYGSAAFASGLRHVVGRSVAFDAHINATVDEVVAEKRSFQNLYTYRPAKAIEQTGLDESIAEAWGRKASPYDSHPPPEQRVAWVTALAAPGRDAPDDDEPVWGLFSDPEAIQRDQTAEVRSILEQRGLEFVGDAPTPPAVADAAE